MKINEDLIEWLRVLSKSHLPRWTTEDKDKAELLLEQIIKESDMNKLEVKQLVISLYETADKIKLNDLREIQCREKLVILEKDIAKIILNTKDEVKSETGSDGKPAFKNETERSVEIENRLNADEQYIANLELVSELKRNADRALIESKHLNNLYNLGTLKYSFLTNNPDESFIKVESETVPAEPAEEKKKNPLEQAKADILNKKEEETPENLADGGEDNGKTEQSGPVEVDETDIFTKEDGVPRS